MAASCTATATGSSVGANAANGFATVRVVTTAASMLPTGRLAVATSSDAGPQSEYPNTPTAVHTAAVAMYAHVTALRPRPGAAMDCWMTGNVEWPGVGVVERSIPTHGQR
jgi:hypothetical protein